jgi:hypothetical protein
MLLTFVDLAEGPVRLDRKVLRARSRGVSEHLPWDEAVREGSVRPRGPGRCTESQCRGRAWRGSRWVKRGRQGP